MSDHIDIIDLNEKDKDAFHHNESSTLNDGSSNITVGDIGNNIILEKPIPVLHADNKKRFGSMITYFFRDNEPLIVIGPHCKIYI
jgi:hypothetical protein